MEHVIKRSIASGILVGIGVVINTVSANKYVGAALFSLALLAIIKNELFLYTGKIGFITEDKVLRKNLFFIIVWNLVGCILTVPILIYSKCLQDSFTEIAVTKFSHGFIYLFLHAFMCGILMYIAVKSKREVITVMAIMAFILSGYEHCIADIPYLAFAISKNMDNTLILYTKFFVIILGNSLGSIFMNYLLASDNKFAEKIS